MIGAILFFVFLCAILSGGTVLGMVGVAIGVLISIGVTLAITVVVDFLICLLAAIGINIEVE
jgi:hypothetical protein